MKLNKKSSLALMRGYISELTLALLLTLLLFCFLTSAQLAEFINKTSEEWFAITGQVLFPAALAIWATYVNLESGEFGDYLRYQNAAEKFQQVFSFPVFIFFFATLSLIFLKGVSTWWLVYPAIFLLNYSAILFVTMTRNLLDVIRLYGRFREQLRKAEAEVRAEKGPKSK